jgi:NAD-dependent dihydropyrimidine dehydrogenase PreA subunit
LESLGPGFAPFDPCSMQGRLISFICKRWESGNPRRYSTMERMDLSAGEWLAHAQEELLDGAIYLEKLKGEWAMLEAELREAKRNLASQQWVAVNDGNPAAAEDLLVWTASQELHKAYWDDERACWMCAECILVRPLTDVTHFRPLPTPPAA